MAISDSPEQISAVDQLRALLHEKGIWLTDYADLLLSLSTLAWAHELRLRRDVPDKRELAFSIVGATADDRAVRRQQRGTGRVDFFTLMSGLSRNGLELLRDIIDKGF